MTALQDKTLTKARSWEINRTHRSLMLQLIRFFGCIIFASQLTLLADSEIVMSAGDSLDLSELTDQNENPFVYNDVMTLVIFVRGMGAKDMVRDALDEIDPACLKGGKLVYVADISKMPGLISKFVAIPRMQKYTYPVWLDTKGEVTSTVPVKDAAVSVISVEKRKIIGIDYLGDAPSLSQRLTAVCGTVFDEP